MLRTEITTPTVTINYTDTKKTTNIKRNFFI